MTNFCDPIWEMDEGMETISLTAEDEGGLMYEEEANELSDIDVRWCLVS